MNDRGCVVLANAIILQAVIDWRELCKAKANTYAFNSLRRFFRSQWCAVLCRNVNPHMLLEKLEKERKAVLEVKYDAKRNFRKNKKM